MKYLYLILILIVSAFATRHEDVRTTKVHSPFRWVFADSAARVAESVTSSDTDKVAYQKSDSTVWVLRDNSPKTWICLDNNTGKIVADTADIGVADIEVATIGEISGTTEVDSLHSNNGCSFSGTVEVDSLHSSNGIRTEEDIVAATARVDSVSSLNGIKTQKNIIADTAKIDAIRFNTDETAFYIIDSTFTSYVKRDTGSLTYFETVDTIENCRYINTGLYTIVQFNESKFVVWDSTKDVRYTCPLFAPVGSHNAWRSSAASGKYDTHGFIPVIVRYSYGQYIVLGSGEGNAYSFETTSVKYSGFRPDSIYINPFTIVVVNYDSD